MSTILDRYHVHIGSEIVHMQCREEHKLPWPFVDFTTRVFWLMRFRQTFAWSIRIVLSLSHGVTPASKFIMRKGLLAGRLHNSWNDSCAVESSAWEYLGQHALNWIFRHVVMFWTFASLPKKSSFLSYTRKAAQSPFMHLITAWKSKCYRIRALFK